MRTLGTEQLARLRALSLMTAVAGLSVACGGGGSSPAPAPPPPPAPVAAVSGSVVGPAGLGQSVLLTLNGSNLDLPITVSSPGCSGIARSTTAPNISSASVAYYTCTATAAGAQSFSVTRSSDAANIHTVAYSVLAPLVSQSSTSAPRYSQNLLLTLSGSNLDLPITVSSVGCSGIARSTTAPNISTATTAYYNCTASAVGSQSFSLVRGGDSASLGSVAYTVLVPQVTMSITGGATGDLVITLSPTQAPITVNNFLNYVKAGYFNGTAFHRHDPGFVLQGGGYAGPLSANATPTLKATNAPIALEVGKGLSNTQYTLAMARTSVLDSATAQFFINLGNNAALDTASGGYAVFGSITSGQALVTQMTAATCVTATWLGTLGCLPVPNLTVSSATQTQ